MAPALLGCLLARRLEEGLLVGRIVETEAYVGEHDLACHARAGRTPRTAVMFGPPGHAYVYLIYGLHRMLNFVCGPDGDANAVLVRAVEPVAGSAPWLHHRAGGRGNVCKAFGIGLSDNAGDLCGRGARLFVAPRPAGSPAPRVVRGPRIGVDYAGRWAGEPLRFCDAGSDAVSRPWPAEMRRGR